MFCLRDDANKMKWLPILVGDSCGKRQNLENYPCFLINTILIYTLIFTIKYYESATAKPVKNFARIFLNSYCCCQLQVNRAHNILFDTVKHLLAAVL